jgi:MSHA pilin protein MshC
MLPSRVKCRGFTMIELIMIMLIVGILAVVAIPKIADKSVFQVRGFTDQVRSGLQYAQKTAIAQRRSVCATLTATSLALTKESSNGAGNACTSGISVTSPTGGAFAITAPGSVTLSSTAGTITFDALGQNTASSATVTVAGAASVVVEQVTGYVR